MCAIAANIAIVQVACGFKRRPMSVMDYRALSQVDHERSEILREYFQPRNQVYVTGMVPYEVEYDERTLANLNADVLQNCGIPGKNIHYVPGLNAFSESWNACQMARENGMKKIVVISSDFYFTAYARMWMACGMRNGLDGEIVSIIHGDLVAQSVWDFYQGAKAQTLSKVAASCSLGHKLAKTLADRMTASRATDGFQIDGHTSIG